MNNKFSRILSMILVLALTLTSFVAVGVVAEAADEVTGKTTLAYEDFSDADMNFTWVKDQTAEATGISNWGLHGTIPGVYSNQYFRWNYNPKSVSVNSNTTLMYHEVAHNATSLDTLAYYVVDFEFSFETPLYKGFYIDLVGKNGSTEVKAQDLYINGINGNLYFGDTLHVVDANSVGLNMYDNNDWRHFTLVVDVAADKMYVYADGEFYYTIDGIFGEATEVTSVRFSYAPEQAHILSHLNYDNIAVTAYSTNSNVNFGEFVNDWTAGLDSCNDAAVAAINGPAQTGSPMAKITKADSSTVTVYSGYDLGSKVVSGDTVEVYRNIAAPVCFVGTGVGTAGPNKAPVGVTFTEGSLAKLQAYSSYEGAVVTWTNYVTKGGTTSNWYVASAVTGYLDDAAAGLYTQQYHGFYEDRMFYVDLYKNWKMPNTAMKQSYNDETYWYTYNLHGFTLGSPTQAKGHQLQLSNTFTKPGHYTFNNGTITGYEIYIPGVAGAVVYFNGITINKAIADNAEYIRLDYNNSTVRFNHSTYNHWFRHVVTDCKVELSFVHSSVTTPPGRSAVVNSNMKGTTDVLNFYAKYTDIGMKKTTAQAFNTTACTPQAQANYNIDSCRIQANAVIRNDNGIVKATISNSYFNAKMLTYSTVTDPSKGGAVVYLNNGNYSAAKMSVTSGGNANTNKVVYEQDSYYRALDNAPAGYAYGTAKVDLKPLANMTLKSDFNFNLYVPTDADVKSVTVGGETYTFTDADVANVNGKDYYKYVNAGIMVTDAAETFDATFNIAHEDGITYAATKTFDIVSYASKVLATPAYAEQATLMVDMLTYVKEAYAYAQVDDADALARINAALEGKTASTYAPTATETNQTAIKDYVDSAFMSLNNVPYIVFTVAQDCNVTFSYYDAKTEATVSETYAAKAGDEIELDMRAYNLVNEITISVEGVGEGTYDLYTYVESQKENNAYALLKALYNYAVAAKAQA